MQNKGKAEKRMRRKAKRTSVFREILMKGKIKARTT